MINQDSIEDNNEVQAGESSRYNFMFKNKKPEPKQYDSLYYFTVA